MQYPFYLFIKFFIIIIKIIPGIDVIDDPVVDKVESTAVDNVGTSRGVVEAGGESDDVTTGDSDVMLVDVADIAAECPCIRRASTSTSSGMSSLVSATPCAIS